MQKIYMPMVLALLMSSVGSIHAVSEVDMVQKTFEYMQTHALSMSEAEMDQLLDTMCASIKNMNKVQMLEQLKGKIEKEIKQILDNGHYNRILLGFGLIGAGLGGIGLVYNMYKNWQTPNSDSIDAIVKELESMGVKIQEHTAKGNYLNIDLIVPKTLTAEQKKAVDSAKEKIKVHAQNSGWAFKTECGVGIGSLIAWLKGTSILTMCFETQKYHNKMCMMNEMIQKKMMQA